jgi:hypothetical protein
MNLIGLALRTFVPTLVDKVFTTLASRKAWAAALAFLHVTSTDDVKKQIAGAAIAGAYVIGQGIHDAAVAKAKAAAPTQ